MRKAVRCRIRLRRANSRAKGMPNFKTSCVSEQYLASCPVRTNCAPLVLDLFEGRASPLSGVAESLFKMQLFR
jgi:hypothetical protein